MTQADTKTVLFRLFGKKHRGISAIGALLLTLIAFSFPVVSTAQEFDHEHAAFTAVLKKYVVSGKYASSVRYAALQKSPEGLNSYLASISAVTRKQFETFSEEQQIAFLINAYNGFTLKLIIDNYPIKSIKDLGSTFTSAWRIKFFELFGKKTHLDKIEHGMLRNNYQEARIHFAVNCASIGCPALLNEAFTATRLDKQLDEGGKRFLADNSRNSYAQRANRLSISKIFKWFGSDFDKSYGSALKYIAKEMKLSESDRANVASGKVKLRYLDYNWRLNDAK